MINTQEALLDLKLFLNPDNLITAIFEQGHQEVLDWSYDLIIWLKKNNFKLLANKIIKIQKDLIRAHHD